MDGWGLGFGGLVPSLFFDRALLWSCSSRGLRGGCVFLVPWCVCLVGLGLLAGCARAGAGGRACARALLICCLAVLVLCSLAVVLWLGLGCWSSRLHLCHLQRPVCLCHYFPGKTGSNTRRIKGEGRAAPVGRAVAGRRDPFVGRSILSLSLVILIYDQDSHLNITRFSPLQVYLFFWVRLGSILLQASLDFFPRRPPSFRAQALR